MDENAFRRRVPEVGAAPDMINDDLPTNLDYLDDAFSTTAGLRELPEDEFDEFEDNYVQSSDHIDNTGLVSRYGGETIRLLQQEGLHTVEHHFDTLPPDLNDESLQ